MHRPASTASTISGMKVALPARPAVDGTTVIVGLGLTAVTLAAWAGVLAQSRPGSGAMAAPMSAHVQLGALTGFVIAWLVMMAAMMLPSAAPLVLLYRVAGPGARAINTVFLVSGYLLVWAAFGVPVFAVQQGLTAAVSDGSMVGRSLPYAVAVVLGLAGLYQFTPLKEACLRQCRSPVDFMMQRWHGGGSFAAMRLGFEHGAYCVGCCWGLMAVLVVAGSMSLTWVTLIALLVFVEKVLPFGRRAGQLSGALLLLLAVTVVVRPDLAGLLSGTGMGM
jgi:predicted metal-binding membrane protein